MDLRRLLRRRAPADAPAQAAGPQLPVLGGRGLRIGLPLAALVALILFAIVSATTGGLVSLGAPHVVRADLVPFDGRSPREPSGERQRVIVALPRPALGEVGEALDARRQRRYVRSLREEAASLRSALAARGVALGDVVGFQRVFNGFAATVDVQDLADLSTLGLRAQPVRRTYPAVSEPAPVGGRAPRAQPEGDEVALLAGGVARAAAARGHDAVDADDDPSPVARLRRREVSGTALAGVLAAAGARVVPVRVSSLRAGVGGVEESGTSDHLLAGLEWVVDPDADGATDDAIPVALAGVHSPYAGFATAPEARAARAAAALGTLLVAPAGHEGGARTIGSPGAAPAALTVGALAAEDAVPRVSLRVGDERVESAALLTGTPARRALQTTAPVTADDPKAYLREGAPRLQGRAAVVRAGASPVAQVAAAAAAGARLVILCEPREDRVLPAVPAGRLAVPVVAVSGDDADALLGVRAGALARVGAVRPPTGIGAAATPAGGTAAPGAAATPAASGTPADPTAAGAQAAPVAPASSRGPSLSGTRKPDLVGAGAARTVLPDGRAAVVGGTGVAAALAAVEAARLAAARPAATPAELAGALRSAAAPLRGPAEATGAGRLRPPAPSTPAEAPPPAMALPAAAPVPLGDLLLTRAGGRVTGVRFTVGAFERGDPFRGGTRVQAAGRLRLELVTAGGDVVRRLTPAGGARDLLPAEYAYTLSDEVRAALPQAPLRFRAVARGPGGSGPAAPSRARSATFTP